MEVLTLYNVKLDLCKYGTLSNILPKNTSQNNHGTPIIVLLCFKLYVYIWFDVLHDKFLERERYDACVFTTIYDLF